MEVIDNAQGHEIRNRRMRELLEMQPEFATLRDRLLKIDGSAVVAMPESNLAELLADGRLFDEPVRMQRGEPCRCHQNVSRLWVEHKAQIATGWGLTARDGLWRQHSWGLRAGRIIETTERRDRYYGVALDELAAEAFAASELMGAHFAD